MNDAEPSLPLAVPRLPAFPVAPPHPLHSTLPVRLPLLELWHLLSLDAPTVATVWTWLLARHAARPASPALLAAMFLATWMLYAGDRLLDTRAATRHTRSQLEARHHFHARHRRSFLLALLPAAAALTLLVTRLPAALRLDYLLLAALLGLWLTLVHRLRQNDSLPKELLVGVFFAAAVLMPAIRARAPLATLSLTFAALTALITLNGSFLAAWERSSPAPLIASLARHRVVLSLALAFACAGLSATHALDPRSSIHSPLAFALCGLSALLLAALERLRSRLAPTTLRALADAALLTPLLCLPFLPAR